MSKWVSVGPDIATRTYIHSGHSPSNRDDAGPVIDLAYIPEHLTRGVWIRLRVGEQNVVLGKRAATQLRDVLNGILAGPRR